METSAQFAKFLFVGGTATAVQYAILYLLVSTGAANPVPASAIGYLVSAVLNYYANYRFTFSSNRAHGVAVPRFIVVAAIGLLLNALLMAIGIRLLGIHYLVTQVIASAIVVAWNFLASRRWSFGVSHR